MPDIPNFMAEITEDRSLSHDTPFSFSNQDADTRTFIPSNSAASIFPEAIIPSTPTSPTTYVPNPASTYKQVVSVFTSTNEASDNDPTVIFPPMAGIQILAENNFENQRKHHPAGASQLDDSPLPS